MRLGESGREGQAIIASKGPKEAPGGNDKANCGTEVNEEDPEGEEGGAGARGEGLEVDLHDGEVGKGDVLEGGYREEHGKREGNGGDDADDYCHVHRARNVCGGIGELLADVCG